MKRHPRSRGGVRGIAVVRGDDALARAFGGGIGSDDDDTCSDAEDGLLPLISEKSPSSSSVPRLPRFAPRSERPGDCDKRRLKFLSICFTQFKLEKRKKERGKNNKLICHFPPDATSHARSPFALARLAAPGRAMTQPVRTLGRSAGASPPTPSTSLPAELRQPYGILLSLAARSLSYINHHLLCTRRMCAETGGTRSLLAARSNRLPPVATPYSPAAHVFRTFVFKSSANSRCRAPPTFQIGTGGAMP